MPGRGRPAREFPEGGRQEFSQVGAWPTPIDYAKRPKPDGCLPVSLDGEVPTLDAPRRYRRRASRSVPWGVECPYETPAVRQPYDFHSEAAEGDDAPGAPSLPDVPDDRRSIDVLNEPASPRPAFYQPPTIQIYRDATAWLRDAPGGPFTRTGRPYSANTRGPEREPDRDGCIATAQRVAADLGVSLEDVQRPYRRIGRSDPLADARRTIASVCYAEGYAVTDIAAAIGRRPRTVQETIQDSRAPREQHASQDDGWPEKLYPWREAKAVIQAQMEAPCALRDLTSRRP